MPYMNGMPLTTTSSRKPSGVSWSKLVFLSLYLQPSRRLLHAKNWQDTVAGGQGGRCYHCIDRVSPPFPVYCHWHLRSPSLQRGDEGDMGRAAVSCRLLAGSSWASALLWDREAIQGWSSLTSSLVCPRNYILGELPSAPRPFHPRYFSKCSALPSLPAGWHYPMEHSTCWSGHLLSLTGSAHLQQ